MQEQMSGVLNQQGDSMVFRGTVVQIIPRESATDVQIELETHGGGDSISQYLSLPGTDTVEPLSPGDRIAWWPCWRTIRAPGSGLRFITEGRLVREADLSVAELVQLEKELDGERQNAQRVEAYRRKIRRDSRERLSEPPGNP